MKPHIFHPDAQTEYIEAARYYASIKPELGGRFYDEIERLIGNICKQPDRFFSFYPPTRRALSRRFPYSVVYIDQPDRVWIVAVAHAKRRPGYWYNRLV